LPAIQTHALTRDYGDLRALDNLDLSVNAGEMFAFLGPNGAGKTTTIRLLTGLIRPTRGIAIIDGLDVSSAPLQVKACVGVVPERSNLYNELSARDNLIFVAKLYGLARRQWHRRADQLLEEFGLADRAGSPFGALSGGLKRRLTIAAALVHRPKILFLDEPTTGLDVQSARSLRATIRTLRASGVTIFLTTHFLAEAEELCDRVAIIVKGNLIATDTPSGLVARCQGEKQLELRVSSFSEAMASALGRRPEIASLSRAGDRFLLTIHSVEAALGAVAAAAQECGATLEAIRTVRPSLEDAFVRLTGIDAETLQRNQARPIQGQGGKR